ncbi:hypothetical protein D3C76_988070 [compost metagenome]
MRFGATHAGDDGMVKIIPFAGRHSGQASHRRVGAICRDHQRRAQGAAIGQGQQPVIAGAAHLLQASIGQQPQVAIVQTLKQGILDHAVLDDMPQHLGMHAGRREVDLPGAAAIPDLHVGVGAAAPPGDAVPHAQALENPLAGSRQGAHPWLKRCLSVERFDAHGAAVQQQDFQPAVLQRQRQGAADHSGPDNQQICAHFHALSLSLLRLEPHVKGFPDPRHQVAGAVMNVEPARQVFYQSRLAESADQPVTHLDAYPAPSPAGQTSVWPVAADRGRASRCCAPGTPAAGYCRTGA